MGINYQSFSLPSAFWVDRGNGKRRIANTKCVSFDFRGFGDGCMNKFIKFSHIFPRQLTITRLFFRIYLIFFIPFWLASHQPRSNPHQKTFWLRSRSHFPFTFRCRYFERVKHKFGFVSTSFWFGCYLNL